jgi:hypothetical protein
MAATNKRLLISESHGDSNRYTPCRGKNSTNMTRMLPTPVHIRPTYASCGRSPYVATLHESPTELDRVTAPEKKGSRHNQQHIGGPIHGSVPSFSPELANEAVEKAKHLSTADY